MFVNSFPTHHNSRNGCSANTLIEFSSFWFSIIKDDILHSRSKEIVKKKIKITIVRITTEEFVYYIEMIFFYFVLNGINQ